MDYREIADKIEELKKSQLYDEEQIKMLRYALNRSDFDANMIMKPSISSLYMKMYIDLCTLRKINVEKYINENWHNKGYSAQQLYIIISGDSLGIDMSEIDPSVSTEQIKQMLNSKLNERKSQRAYDNSNLPQPVIEQIEAKKLSSEIKSYILRISNQIDIFKLLELDLENYSLEQIKYLVSVLSTGEDISIIASPTYTVEQMKTLMLNSANSQSFLNEIIESNHGREN